MLVLQIVWNFFYFFSLLRKHTSSYYCSIFGHRTCSRVSGSGRKPLSHSSSRTSVPILDQGDVSAEQQTSGDCPCATCLHTLENALPQIIWAAGRAAWVGDYRPLHTAVKDISSTWLSGCGREHPEGGRGNMERLYIYLVRECTG